MMEIILFLNELCKKVIARGIGMASVLETGVFEKIVKIKYDIPNDNLEMFEDYKKDIKQTLDELLIHENA